MNCPNTDHTSAANVAGQCTSLYLIIATDNIGNTN